MQQGGKVKTEKRTGRLIFLIIILLVLAIATIFSLPIVNIPFRTTETYFETEYEEEPYTELETYTVQTTPGSTGNSSQTIFQDTLFNLGASIIPDRWGTEIPFKLDVEGKSNAFIRGNWEVENFDHAIYATITDPRYHIIYQYRGDEASPQKDSFSFVPEISGTYTFRLSSTYVRLARYGRLTLVLEWGGSAMQATEQKTTRQVTRYRQVPVQVEKERTVTQYNKGSVWEALFGSED